MRPTAFLNGLLQQKLVYVELFLFPALAPVLIAGGFSASDVMRLQAVSLGSATLAGWALFREIRRIGDPRAVTATALALVVVACALGFISGDAIGLYGMRAVLGAAVGLLQPMLLMKVLPGGASGHRQLGRLETAMALTTVVTIPLSLLVTSLWGWQALYLPVALVAALCLYGCLGERERGCLRIDPGPAPGFRQALPSLFLTLSGQLLIPIVAMLLTQSYRVSTAGLALYYAATGPLGMVAAALAARLLDRTPIESAFARVAAFSALSALALAGTSIPSPAIGLFLATAFSMSLSARRLVLSAWYAGMPHSFAGLALMSGTRSLTITVGTLVSALAMDARPDWQITQWASVFAILSAAAIGAAALSLKRAHCSSATLPKGSAVV